ncbi:MAG: hypothetical protein KDE27_00365 [Planctomycetes bacterium]|nr:hypothetical protein [Planctomycetota bacterium]
MTRYRLHLAALALVSAIPLAAQDQLVKQALSRIEKVETALPNLAAGDTAAANRLLTDLRWAEKRLNAAYKKDTVHWKDAAKRLEAADKTVRERASATPKPAESKDKEQEKPTTEPTGKANSTSTPPGDTLSGEQIAKLQQLRKEVENGFHNLRLLNKSFMGDAYRVGSTEKELAGLEARLADFPAGAADVREVAARLAEFRGLFTQWRAEYAADQASAGGLKQQLDAITARYTSEALPGAIYWPYELDKLQVWADRTQQLLDVIPQDVTVLQQATGHSELGKQAKNLLHRVSSAVPRQLQEQIAKVRYACDTAVRDSLTTAKRLREVDPTDRQAITNVVLLEGALDRNLEVLQQGMEAVDRAAVLDRALRLADAPDRGAQRAEIEATVGVLRKLAVAALADVRMPKAAALPEAKMAELTAIATATLAKEKYGIHPIAKLVVTSDLQRKEKTEGDIRGTVTGARITAYHYVWDEFRVVTAERIGDEVWVHHNLLKYYHSSDTVTPQGEWILSRRFQGTQILPDNVDR